jgi:hypothetical protein
MRVLGTLTALFAALLVGVLGFPTYSPPFLRLAVGAMALVGFVAGVLLAVGQPLDGWSRRLALVFTVAVVIFGVLLLVQGALSTLTLGAALRYQIFSTLPALLLAIFLLRQAPSS